MVYQRSPATTRNPHKNCQAPRSKSRRLAEMLRFIGNFEIKMETYGKANHRRIHQEGPNGAWDSIVRCDRLIKIIMKKFCLLLLLVSIKITSIAKTTYIPTYESYIHIVNGCDTVAVTNNLMDLDLGETDGLFSIRIEHEDLTKEKVKAVKRAKRRAGWMTLSAVMSGVSTAFSRNSLQYMVRSTYTRLASELASFYIANAKAEQTLKIDVWIENTSGEELMINDMERGLTWYLEANQEFHIQLHNPDAANLRISDVKNGCVRKATIIAGSIMKKWDISWEDDECWISPVYKEGEIHKSDTLLHYVKISKADYSETEMSIDSYKSFSKEMKKKGIVSQ